MLLLFQSISVTGGPWWVTAILVMLIIAMGIVNLLQFAKGREVARWRAAAEAADKTADIYKSELAIVRERAQRVEDEKGKLVVENAELRGRTDLTKLERQIAEAVAATTERHAAVLGSVVKLSDTMQSHAAHEERVLGEISATMSSSARIMQDICSRLESFQPSPA